MEASKRQASAAEIAVDAIRRQWWDLSKRLFTFELSEKPLSIKGPGLRMGLTPMSARSLVWLYRVLPCACGIWWPHPNVRTAQIEVTLLGQMEVEHSGFELFMLFFVLWSVGLGISEVQRSLRRWDRICPCVRKSCVIGVWSHNAIDSIAELKQQEFYNEEACVWNRWQVDSCQLWWHFLLKLMERRFDSSSRRILRRALSNLIWGWTAGSCSMFAF